MFLTHTQTFPTVTHLLQLPLRLVLPENVSHKWIHPVFPECSPNTFPGTSPVKYFPPELTFPSHAVEPVPLIQMLSQISQLSPFLSPLLWTNIFFPCDLKELSLQLSCGPLQKWNHFIFNQVHAWVPLLTLSRWGQGGGLQHFCFPYIFSRVPGTFVVCS